MLPKLNHSLNPISQGHTIAAIDSFGATVKIPNYYSFSSCKEMERKMLPILLKEKGKFHIQYTETVPGNSSAKKKNAFMVEKRNGQIHIGSLIDSDKSAPKINFLIEPLKKNNYLQLCSFV